MASIRYLWSNRVVFSFYSPSFYITWAKRLITFPDLVKRNLRKKKLTQMGANIHDNAEIGYLKVDGDRRKLLIGEFSFIGRVYMALHDKIEIGACVCVNDGVQLLTGSHGVDDPYWSLIKKKIIIKDYAWIATNAIILPNVTIGYGAIVGAGAVVSKSIDDFDIVVGNPAKSIGKTRTKQLKYNPCDFLASNRAWLVG